MGGACSPHVVRTVAGSNPAGGVSIGSRGWVGLLACEETDRVACDPVSRPHMCGLVERRMRRSKDAPHAVRLGVAHARPRQVLFLTGGVAWWIVRRGSVPCRCRCALSAQRHVRLDIRTERRSWAPIFQVSARSLRKTRAKNGRSCSCNPTARSGSSSRTSPPRALRGPRRSAQRPRSIPSCSPPRSDVVSMRTGRAPPLTTTRAPESV
jgi:hypothetical protein